MRISRLNAILTLGVFVLSWSSCNSGGTGGNFGSVGPGNTATYIVFTDNSRVNVESINANGKLTAILGSPVTAGTQPSAIAVTPDGKFIYVLNTGSNSLSQFAIAADGTLTKPQNDLLTGTLPVSIAVDSQQHFAAVANKTSGTVSLYRIDPSSGALFEFGSSPITTGNNPVAVTIHGNFVYAIAPNSIAEIAVDPINFTTSVPLGSPFPAGAVGTLSGGSAGTQLYALDSTNNVVQGYTLNVSTGIPTFGTSIASGTQPVAALQILNGGFLYVANKGSNNVSGYSINASTGALTVIAGSPFTTGTGPSTLAFDPVNNLLLVGNSTSSNLSVFTVNATTGVLTSAGTPVPLTGLNTIAVAKP